jgi:NAD-dependent SIR2 family protein deacetylase
MITQVKTIKCNNCGETLTESIKPRNRIIEWFKIKRCPLCKALLNSGTYTLSSGPR